MQNLPEGLILQSRTPDFDQHSIPKGIQGLHTTAEGIWGKIVISEGSLTYRIFEPELEQRILNEDRYGVVAPQAAHQVELKGPVKFHIEFYREAA